MNSFRLEIRNRIQLILTVAWDYAPDGSRSVAAHAIFEPLLGLDHRTHADSIREPHTLYPTYESFAGAIFLVATAGAPAVFLLHQMLRASLYEHMPLARRANAVLAFITPIIPGHGPDLSPFARLDARPAINLGRSHRERFAADPRNWGIPAPVVEAALSRLMATARPADLPPDWRPDATLPEDYYTP